MSLSLGFVRLHFSLADCTTNSRNLSISKEVQIELCLSKRGENNLRGIFSNNYYATLLGCYPPTMTGSHKSIYLFIYLFIEKEREWENNRVAAWQPSILIVIEHFPLFPSKTFCANSLTWLSLALTSSSDSDPQNGSVLVAWVVNYYPPKQWIVGQFALNNLKRR
jgi:hypothetical protein